MRRKVIDTIPILTKEMYKILIRLTNSKTLSADLKKRAQIVLKSAEGKTTRQIAKEVGLSVVSTSKWRNRFLKAHTALIVMGETSPEKLYGEIVKILSDESRSVHPVRLSQEQVEKTIDLISKSPQDYGYEVSQWSLSLLAKVAVKLGIAKKMSAKTVSRFLKKANISLIKLK